MHEIPPRPIPPWIRIIRWFLAAVYIVYGVTKLLGGQFHHGPFTIDSATVDGTFFVWAFFGWKMPYSIFIGLGELVPGILLLFNRTATIGALLLLPVVVNITVLTFAFGFPSVKYVSLGYAVLVAVLIGWDLPRLRAALWPAQAPRAVPFSRRGRLALFVLGLPAVFLFTTMLAESLSPGPEPAVLERLVARGVPGDSLVLVRSRYTGQLFGRGGTVEFRTLDSSRVFRAEIGRPIALVAWRVLAIEESNP